MRLDEQVHLVFDRLFRGVDLLQYLRHDVDELFGCEASLFGLEFLEEFGGRHGFAHEVPSNCIFGYAGLAVGMRVIMRKCLRTCSVVIENNLLLEIRY